MIKLFKVKGNSVDSVYDDLYFADLEEDKVYDLEITPTYLGDTLTDSGLTVDENFDIEDAEEVEITDYFKVKYIVDEKNTYAIKDEIKAQGGKWDASEKVWTLSKPSESFKTKAYYTKKLRG